MRTHTEPLMNYLNSSMRQLKVRLSCSAGTIENVQSLDYSTDFGSCIAIGNTVSASIRVTCKTPAFSLRGIELVLAFGAPDPDTDGQTIWTQMGIFKVTELENRMGFSTFTAYDRMYANTLEEYRSQLEYPATLQAVLNEICAKCGLTAPAITANPTLQNDYLSEYTLRDAIGFIAGYQGKNAYIDCDGKLIFKWFSTCTYTADDHMANVPYSDERNIRIDKVICSTGDDNIQSGNGSEGIIFNNPMMTQERLDEILTAVKDFTYRRLDADILVGNYLIESGDIIKITSSGEELTVPAMSVSFHYDGGISCKLSSYGVPDTVMKSISAKRFTDQTKIKGLKEEIVYTTEKITGANGGFVRINFGDDGKTAEILILDKPEIDNPDPNMNAKNVWRWNKEGLGHSHNGYNGPYDDVAVTADGHLVADRIAGNLISGVAIKTTTSETYSQSYAKLQEGGLNFYTPEGYLVGSVIEVWENPETSDTAGTLIATDKNRWIAIGKYVEGGWYSEFTYRPNDYYPFTFIGHTKFETEDVKIKGKLFLRRYGTDDEYDNVEDELHSLRERVSALEEIVYNLSSDYTCGG